jgi:ribonuclease P protein component
MSQSLSFTFGRHERLKSDVLISQLYTQGKSISKYPLRITYLVHPPLYYIDSSVKVSIHASKKGLRLAVKRNRMKRVLREIYRHHKHPLQNMLNRENYCLSIGIVYVGTHLSEYEPLERLYLKLQKRIIDAIAAERASDARMTSEAKEDVTGSKDVASDINKDITSVKDVASDIKEDITGVKNVASDNKEDITGSKNSGSGVKEDS